jgi:tetratricopeptide (TPR) repeat protein
VVARAAEQFEDGGQGDGGADGGNENDSRPLFRLVIATEGLDAEVAAAVAQAGAEVRARPRSAATWGQLGMVLFGNDMLADCVGVLEQAERLDPADSRWPYLRGLALILQTPEAGIAALKCAAEVPPVNLPMRLRLAEESLKLERIDEADELFRALLTEHPNHPRILLGHGQILARHGRWREAVVPLTAAAADPLAQRSARAALAEAYLRQGETARADAERKRAATSAADQTWPDPYIAEAERFRTGLLPRIEQTLRLRDDGQIRDALNLIAEVLHDHPASDEAHLTRAKVLIAARAPAEAEDALRRAIELNPGRLSAHLLLAQIRLAKADYAGAERCYRRTVELQPGHGLAHYQLGVCLLKQGDAAGAKGAFRDAVRYRPDLAAAHAELGALLLKEGQRAEAIGHLENAVRLDEKNEQARRLLEKTR